MTDFTALFGLLCIGAFLTMFGCFAVMDSTASHNGEEKRARARLLARVLLPLGVLHLLPTIFALWTCAIAGCK